MGWQIPLAVWLGVAATLAGVFGVIFRDDKEAARDAVVAAIFWPALAVCAVAVAPLYILGPLASWLIMAVVYVSGFVTGAWAALIRKGDTYYKVSLKTGPRSSRTLKSLKPFKRSQLTTSDYKIRTYDVADDVIPAIKVPGDLEDLKSQVEEIKSDQEEKLENLPDNLKEAPSGQTIQERIDECEEFISHLDAIEFEEEDDYDDDEFDSYEDYVASVREEIASGCPW